MTELQSSFRDRPLWKQIRRGALLLYGVLLVASHLVRSFESDLEPGPSQSTVLVREVDNGNLLDREVGLSYIDSAPDSTDLPVILLLHGSPVASSFMMKLHRALASEGAFRIITPDLPGFEGSSRTIADYSVEALAHYLDQFLDSLSIGSAHIIGYSMSGGVALQSARIMPERVESIVMLSAIGVQELELMGDYLLNHSVHALQLAGLWLIQEAVPHFGWMDDAILTRQYARNFFDTDQRPLRNILTHYTGPMLIIHGSEDFLVPPSAALEHHRIVPQSRLEMLEDGGHGMVVTIPDTLAGLIVGFSKDVEAGRAPTYADATQARLRAASHPFDMSSLPRATGFQLIVLMILIAGATLVSEDLASIGAGLMAARGTFGFEHALIAAFAGILLGDVGLYASGRLFGQHVVRLPPMSWMIDERRLQRAAAWFREKGGRVIVASRFIPGSRLPTYVAAGTLKAPFWKFMLYFLAATAIWTPIIVGSATIVGNRMLEFYSVYEAYALWVLLGAVLLIYAAVHVGFPLASHLGRRRFLSRWRRLTRWEFWPPWVFYAPVAGYILWLAIKHRSLTVFTAANPAIENGGFLGESKSQILRLVGSAGSFVAPFVAVPESEHDSGAEHDLRLDRVEGWMEEMSIHYPIVLKPDVGERGHGVFIARTRREVRDYLAQHPGKLVAQKYISGPEYGVFYIRYPESAGGQVFSVTEKHLVSVTGDGNRRLENLIWDDERAMCSAPVFLKRFADQLDEIPAEGEQIRLVDVGTHCRGAEFRDGRDMITPEVEAVFDRIARSIEGFYFGRFDIRITDLNAFPETDSFAILELNGVSSEATHIYDPDISLPRAYAVLFKQWRAAFEIGAYNVSKGLKKERLTTLLKLIWVRKIYPEDRPDTSAGARELTPVT